MRRGSLLCALVLVLAPASTAIGGELQYTGSPSFSWPWADAGLTVDVFGGAGLESIGSEPVIGDPGIVVNSNPELGLSLGWADDLFEVSLDLKNSLDDTREAHVTALLVF